MRYLLLLLLFSVSLFWLPAQQTVGLFTHDVNAYPGYNLFAPMPGTTTYLLDNCGREIHNWSSANRPGLSAYLLEDGSLLRAGNAGNNLFTAGGSGGMVEIIDWNGNQTWEYQHSSTTYCHHHDVEMLPNGNVLMIAWELKSEANGLAQGRDPSNLTSDGIWPDKIIEVQPTGQNTGTIVWEWHAWDHLIQDFDSNQANFGVVADHPELIDVNYPGPNGPQQIGNTDWLHINGVDYNADLDQILLSVHNLDEFWIIDHSTTTAEAAGHNGGNSGKGGDLLYRWGNPQAYDRGSAADQQLYAQHDARWIADTLPNPGMIMVFNNGDNSRPNSSVEIVDPPVDQLGNYSLTTGNAFGPTTPFWSYDGGTTNSWYSQNISGAHPLPNGNVLICDGPAGRFFEVDASGGVHWEYVSPIVMGGASTEQGQPVAGNAVFRVHRYGLDYPGFTGRTLTPGVELELNGVPNNGALCTLTDLVDVKEIGLVAYPNPFEDKVRISIEGVPDVEVEIFDLMGRILLPKTKMNHGDEIDTSNWDSGLYFVRFHGEHPTDLRMVKY